MAGGQDDGKVWLVPCKLLPLWKQRICLTVGERSSSFATDTWFLNAASTTSHLDRTSFCLIIHYQEAKGSEPGFDDGSKNMGLGEPEGPGLAPQIC